MIHNERALQPESRALLVFFTLLLLVATHWPALEIKGPVSRTDLVLHAGVFCVWTWLLYAAGLVGVGRRGLRGSNARRLVLTAIAGVAFACFDELTQPLMGRIYDPLDLLANFAGVLLAVGAIALLQRQLRWGEVLARV